MPVVRKLPIEAIITQDGRSGALTGRPHKVQQQQQQQQHTSRRLKSDIITNWCSLSVITVFITKHLSKCMMTKKRAVYSANWLLFVLPPGFWSAFQMSALSLSDVLQLITTLDVIWFFILACSLLLKCVKADQVKWTKAAPLITLIEHISLETSNSFLKITCMIHLCYWRRVNLTAVCCISAFMFMNYTSQAVKERWAWLIFGVNKKKQKRFTSLIYFSIWECTSANSKPSKQNEDCHCLKFCLVGFPQRFW